MNATIDHTRLEKLRKSGRKITARCPACAADDGDKSGVHFFQNTETGQFGCAKFPGDKEHRRDIFRLVGIRGERDPIEEKAWRQARTKIAAAELSRRKLSTAIRAKRAHIIAAHPWSESQALAESPEQRKEWFQDPRNFIAALFPYDAIVWTGDTYHTGQEGRCASHWKTVRHWQSEPKEIVGPMIAPATWPPGTTSRSSANVMASPYVVLDFDGFDGVQPKTPDELRAHISASLAIVRWMREALAWKLAAVLFTGSKSIHAWFHTPPLAALESLKHTALALGIDAGLIDHPEHPCRLPGWIHSKTGIPARVLWLQSKTIA
jgi:hypothetical protein